MCDVVLINLPVSLWYKKDLARENSMPPLGILYIATVLNQNGIQTKVLDLAVEMLNKEELKQYFLENNPRIVGMSTYNESWGAQKVLSTFLKEILPSVVIMAGGAFASFYYEVCLNESDVDFITQGEGEYSVLELCKKILYSDGDYYKIDGLIWKEKGKN